ncbi:MAG: HAF repeat-containing protein [Armatimonadota bacterium]|nr:HAF repeat-containing protein [Armatimonadota bacterium]
MRLFGVQRWHWAFRSVAVFLCSCVLLPVGVAQPTLIWLGVPAGGADSVVRAVSADGRVVVGYSAAQVGGALRAFRWTRAAGFEGLGTLGGNAGIAYAVSAAGTFVVGAAQDASGSVRPVRWGSSGIEALGLPSGARGGIAYSVSADGSVIAGQTSYGGGVRRATLWTGTGAVQDLGVPTGSVFSIGVAISADGTTVAATVGVAPVGLRAARWTAADGWQLIANDESIARGISVDGSTIVGQAADADGNYIAFRWRAGSGIQLLGLPFGGDWSDALAASADGAIVVGYARTADGSEVAARWIEGVGWQDLNAVYASLLSPGSTLTRAAAITPDGRFIAGFGFNADTGRTEGWLLDTVPEPSTLTALAAALALSSLHRFAQRKLRR